MVALKRTRVLVLAEACNPTWTSVPLVGYQIAKALALRNDLQIEVVTHERNRAALVNDELSRLVNVHYIDSDMIGGPLHRLGVKVRGGSGLGWTIRTAFAWPAYVLFEHLVHEKFARRLSNGDFDLIHRVTPLTPSFGSPLVGMTDVPMVIGPLNGGLPWPTGFTHRRDAEREWLDPVRNLHRALPYHRSTLLKARTIIAGSRHTANELRRGNGLRAVLSENAVDTTRFPLADHWPEQSGRFKFITVGRCVPCKAVDLIIRALAKSDRLKDSELLVIGDGPLKNAWQEEAQRLGIADRVQFPGWIPNTELAATIRSAQAFIFPSIREFGGGAVLEAMACGLPSVVANYGGPAELVDASCGFTVPVDSEENLVSHLENAMVTLANSPELCRSMGQAAIARVKNEFTWESKAAQLSMIYQNALAH